MNVLIRPKVDSEEKRLHVISRWNILSPPIINFPDLVTPNLSFFESGSSVTSLLSFSLLKDFPLTLLNEDQL